MCIKKVDLENVDNYVYILLLYGDKGYPIPHTILYKDLKTLTGVVRTRIKNHGYFQDTDCLVTVCCNI